MSPEMTAALDLLHAHPWIAAAAHDGTGLQIRLRPEATAVRPGLGPLVREYLDHWAEVYDYTYAAGAGNGDTLAGWRASDTGEPLPVAHMTEWVERTVELVLATRPRHVLELGCGTGLLAGRLYPHLAGYVGTDVAEDMVRRHEQRARPGQVFVSAGAHESSSEQVRRALDRAGVPTAGPDCVLVNSVTQCFPDVAYLSRVVQDAVRLVAPGGVVIVGDNRHAGLLDAYCHWLERAADPEATDSVITERARARADRDDELNFDPAVLARAAMGSGRDVRIAAYPKTMTADTELTRYRFDAVLHVEAADACVPPAAHNWAGMDDARAMIAEGRPIRIGGIPNRLLVNAADAVTAHQLRTALAGADVAVVLDQSDPAALALVAPAAAAFTSVASAPGRAHEPFTAFVRRRVGEATRAMLRQAGADTRGLRLTVDRGVPADRIAAAAARAVDPHDAERLPVFLQELDRIARLAMADTLAGADLCTGPSGDDEEKIAAALAIAPRHQWIMRRWLAVLVDAGMLSTDGHRYHDLRAPGRTALVAAVDGIDDARRGLHYPPELTRFFQTAVQYLPALLRDEVSLQALLFADGETGTAEGAYRDNAVNRYVNAATAEALRWAAQWRPADRPLRVLEVGAGVGGTTVDVLDALRETPLDYLFTDVSTFFLTDARRRFADRAGLRYGRFDINTDILAQDVGEGTLDVVLAANVLHNAVDIAATLRGFRRLLQPGGVLLFVETTREMHQILTSMQFLMSARPGGQRPGDRDRRAGTGQIFLDETQWRAELDDAGFSQIVSVPGPDHPLHPVGVQLFAATT
ncbi:class I SAM-dependent methyltransferase [Micromonospora sp. B11E3]|uniref:class I SAM-dependent methyltransferase n=1 Tax=Micromonospora sp. B11E3 TaxID=3153562 RepID=UPI00325F4635